MPYTKAFIPYGGYYSTPFVRWNGSLKGENPVVLGAATARRWFVEKKIDPTVLDFLYYGQTVTSPLTFFWPCLCCCSDSRSGERYTRHGLESSLYNVGNKPGVGS